MKVRELLQKFVEVDQDREVVILVPGGVNGEHPWFGNTLSVVDVSSNYVGSLINEPTVTGVVILTEAM